MTPRSHYGLQWQSPYFAMGNPNKYLILLRMDEQTNRQLDRRTEGPDS
jgi:hypothetical protein